MKNAFDSCLDRGLIFTSKLCKRSHIKSTNEKKRYEIMMTSHEIIDLFKKMLTIRMFEEKAAELYTEGHIYGFCHLYIGQEAVAVGIQHNMSDIDSSITSYRDHGHMIVCGVDPKYVMAELCGKSTGCSKGKGGSMHMYSKSHNFYGGNGIVGAQVPIGTGLALAHNYKNDGGISVVYFGDGAANQGQVYEAFNMASIWKLPVLYVLENNHYAMGTAAKRVVSGHTLKNRGLPFDIPCIECDGMDLFDVIEKSKDAIEYVRSGKGPLILYVDTYRYRGHSMSDPATYRTREEVDNIKKNRDPILKVKEILMTGHNISDDQIEEIEDEISEIIENAAEFAINSSEPEESDLYRDVLV